MEMQISFPGNKRVTSSYKGFTVETDQPKAEGGDGLAPEPFDLFLSSLGTCAGVYIAYFCESRNIATKGLSMTLAFDQDKKTHQLQAIKMTIHLPEGFPQKYRHAVERAAGMCTVKRVLASPPAIEIVSE